MDIIGLYSTTVTYLASKAIIFGEKRNIRAITLFKVIEVGTNRKPICDFLLVINSNRQPDTDMTYNVFGGTLSLTQSINQPISYRCAEALEPYIQEGYFWEWGGTGLEQLQMPSGKLLTLLVLLTVIYPIVLSLYLLRSVDFQENIKIVPPDWCQILKRKCAKIDFARSSAPDLAKRAYSCSAPRISSCNKGDLLSRDLRSFEIRFDFESNFRFGIRFVVMIRFKIFESSAPSIVLCKETIGGG